MPGNNVAEAAVMVKVGAPLPVPEIWPVELFMEMLARAMVGVSTCRMSGILRPGCPPVSFTVSEALAIVVAVAVSVRSRLAVAEK